MSKYLAFVLIISFRIFYQPDVNASIPGFAKPENANKPALGIAGARVVSVTANL